MEGGVCACSIKDKEDPSGRPSLLLLQGETSNSFHGPAFSIGSITHLAGYGNPPLSLTPETSWFFCLLEKVSGETLRKERRARRSQAGLSGEQLQHLRLFPRLHFFCPPHSPSTWLSAPRLSTSEAGIKVQPCGGGTGCQAELSILPGGEGEAGRIIQNWVSSLARNVSPTQLETSIHEGSSAGF